MGKVGFNRNDSETGKSKEKQSAREQKKREGKTSYQNQPPGNSKQNMVLAAIALNFCNQPLWNTDNIFGRLVKPRPFVTSLLSLKDSLSLYFSLALVSFNVFIQQVSFFDKIISIFLQTCSSKFTDTNGLTPANQ